MNERMNECNLPSPHQKEKKKMEPIGANNTK